MKTLSEYTKRIKLGEVDGKSIYLSAPSWDCDWYWGFGYLGNKYCHYHVKGLTKIETYDFERGVSKYEFTDLHNGLKKHFGDTFIVTSDNDIWTLAELFESFYSLKEYAELCHKGCAGLSTNPCAELLKNTFEETRINTIVLPQIFEAIYKILNKYIG